MTSGLGFRVRVHVSVVVGDLIANIWGSGNGSGRDAVADHGFGLRMWGPCTSGRVRVRVGVRVSV